MTDTEKLAVAIKALRSSIGAYYLDGSGAQSQYEAALNGLIEIGEIVRGSDRSQKAD